MAIASSSTDQPCPEKAAEYKSAIEQRGDVDSMYKLASLLTTGTDDLQPDPLRAIALFRRAVAEGNHLPSMISLAALLHTGARGAIPVDIRGAIHMYELAIEEYDDAVAMCKRALLTLEDMERTVEEEERALDYLQRSADKGYANAMGELGLMHHVGWGSFTKDLARAAALFRQAIDVGRVTNSMYYLAWIVFDGYDDVPPDPDAAVDLLQQAIDEGNDTDAMVFLAKILRDGQNGVPRDWKRAEGLLRRAVDAGHSSALYHLGCLYLNGDPAGDEGRRDVPKAVELLHQSIDRHEDKHAMFKLAMVLKEGYDGKPGDAAAAAALLRRAVDQGGHIHAMLELAMLLRGGSDGVERDDEAADDLLRAIDARIQMGPQDVNVDAANLLAYAADHGDRFAELLVGIHYKFGDEPFGLDKMKALSLLRKAADGNNSEAMFHLGMMLMDGIGAADEDEDEDEDAEADDEGEGASGKKRYRVEPDLEQAMGLFRKAADEHNNLAAINVLASFLLEGYRDIEADVEQAVRHLEQAIELGDTHSMNRLGMLYLEGYLMPGGRNLDKAVGMFRRAVEKEDVNAAHNLAIVLRNEGIGDAAREGEAVRLLEEAIEKRRHFRSMVAMADVLLCRGDVEDAGRLIEEAVEMGDLDAGNLHTALRNGGYEDDDGHVDDDDDDDGYGDDDSIDYSGRAAMFRDAFMHGGQPVAFYSLGCLVQESQADVCADARAAARWYQRAMDSATDGKGHGLSAVALGCMLLHRGEDGDGGSGAFDDIPKDVERAREVLEQAAQHGNVEAKQLLESIGDE